MKSSKRLNTARLRRSLAWLIRVYAEPIKKGMEVRA